MSNDSSHRWTSTSFPSNTSCRNRSASPAAHRAAVVRALAARPATAPGLLRRYGRQDLAAGGLPRLAAGPGGGPHVRVVDPADLAERAGFFAFDPGYTGGVALAPADLDGDGRNDLLAGQAAGAGAIRAFAGDD
ncbi:MAG: hypothetical protein K2X87_02250, partial [Gemmataceae bacterium]|nr:hypothetical protein [Gemmataceae bacterium]